MPSYFYHLTFELYPNPEPNSEIVSTTTSRGDIWLPPASADVFADLPSHPGPVGQPTRSRQTAPDSWYGQARTPVTDTLLHRNSNPNPGVIDCGLSRGPVADEDRKFESVLDKSWQTRFQGSPPPPLASAALQPRTAVRDWRFGRVRIETVDLIGMSSTSDQTTTKGGPLAAPSLGPTLNGAGRSNKAEFVPLRTKNTELGWGVVHFYREGEETPSLDLVNGDEENISEDADGKQQEYDLTTVCIPAVPAYMSPGDFLGFVGEKWRDDISHCRLVMTSKLNKYLALLKFRDSERAKQWRKEFDGKIFNTMEPQICHVVFVRRISFKTPQQSTLNLPAATSSSAVSNSLKPFPPPTPNLIELPTCPVCLERMDETNGLMTIPCSHVFHCTCLQNWKGAGCPVCRFTNAPQSDSYDPSNPYTQPFGSSVSNLCSVCDCTDDLWICLICGHVGCGRYKGAHAKDHWKETAHSFALELETQHVWDYAGDMWVHRLIRDKGDGKVVELPGRSHHHDHQQHAPPDEDVVPRAKLESIGLEYTHLITSQLESQRAYYEEMLSKAVSKASKASAIAEAAAEEASNASQKLSLLNEKYDTLCHETIPQLERDLEREKNRSNKTQELARNLGKSAQEEKRLNEGLMKRIEHLNADTELVRKNLEELKMENTELKEMNRDLSMFISGQEKLKEMESEGQLNEGEIEGGTASVPDKKGKRRGRK